MATITWSTDVNAPGCPGEILPASGPGILIQTDYDAPGVATTFGWDIRSVQHVRTEPDGTELRGDCDHAGTDGTVECPACGVLATAFIAGALDWLAENDGATAEDPGYFGEE